jgi:hypothetical protein
MCGKNTDETGGDLDKNLCCAKTNKVFHHHKYSSSPKPSIMQIPKQNFLTVAPLALGLLFLTMTTVMSCSESQKTPAEEGKAPSAVATSEAAKPDSPQVVPAEDCKECPMYWPANDITRHRIFSIDRPNHASVATNEDDFTIALKRINTEFFLEIKTKGGQPHHMIKLLSTLPPRTGTAPCWLDSNCPAFLPFKNWNEIRVLTVNKQCADQEGYEVYLRRKKVGSIFIVSLEISSTKNGLKSDEDIRLGAKIPPELG